MAAKISISTAALRAFDKVYDPAHEDLAATTRGQFLRAFPMNKLAHMVLEDYVIGLQRPTFCTFVEVGTRPWATIHGATAKKFGIYFGQTKADKSKTYRFSRRFGDDQETAFKAVKNALIELIKLAKASTLDFSAIDANSLSQMFKAKILSLYFPERFLNVCSRDHLQMLGAQFGFPPKLPVSQYQHLLLQTKESGGLTQGWSNPKFMAFLYRTYIHEDVSGDGTVVKPKGRVPRRVDFGELQKQWSLIGQAAEKFARDWEESRLEGAGLAHLIPIIEDRRDRPGYGYDFRSYSSIGQERFIEVKAVGKLRGGLGYRFFLSENEHGVSTSADQGDHYYFYLVFFDGNSVPCSVTAIRARDLYKVSYLFPAAYTVQFALDR